jgi:hypothetical protein
MKSDKFLIGIVLGIIILVIVAISVVLTRSQSEEYIADDNPAGVVHNYFLAIQRRDYDKAYSYLSDEIKAKPDLNDFILNVEIYGNQPESSLKIDESTINGNRAQVRVAITSYSGGGGLFDRGSYTSRDTVHLRANPAGEWKILQFPYPYWSYNWNNPPDSD